MVAREAGHCSQASLMSISNLKIAFSYLSKNTYIYYEDLQLQTQSSEAQDLHSALLCFKNPFY